MYLKSVFFNDWLNEFRKHLNKYGRALNWNSQAVKNELVDYMKGINKKDYRTLGFIKYSVFEFLLNKAPDDYFEDLALVSSLT